MSSAFYTNRRPALRKVQKEKKKEPKSVSGWQRVPSDIQQKPNQNKNPLCTSESLITGNFPMLWSAISQPQLGACNLRTLEMGWRQEDHTFKVGFSYIVYLWQTWAVWESISKQRKLMSFCLVHLSCVSLNLHGPSWETWDGEQWKTISFFLLCHISLLCPGAFRVTIPEVKELDVGLQWHQRSF